MLIRDAYGRSGTLAGAFDRGEQHGNQHRDNCDDHQEFDEREPDSTVTVSLTGQGLSNYCQEKPQVILPQTCRGTIFT